MDKEYHQYCRRHSALELATLIHFALLAVMIGTLIQTPHWARILRIATSGMFY